MIKIIIILIKIIIKITKYNHIFIDTFSRVLYIIINYGLLIKHQEMF